MAIGPFQLPSLRVIREDKYRNGMSQLVFPFESNMIKLAVPEDIVRGNYRIGVIENDEFRVKYVGRSTDQNLQRRILQHKNTSDDHYYNDSYFFFYSSASTDDEAIKQECIDFHSFGEDVILDNKVHPALPVGAVCPFQGCNHVGGE